MPVKGSDAVGKRRGARGNSGVERRPMNANVGDADGRPQRSSWSHAAQSSHLREVEVQERQLRGTHLDCYGMTPWITWFGTGRRSAVRIECDVVIAVGFVQRRIVVPVLVRGRTVVMSRMVVSRVLVHMQRRDDTRCSRESRNEQRCQKALHSGESMGRRGEGQPHA